MISSSTLYHEHPLIKSFLPITAQYIMFRYQRTHCLVLVSFILSVIANSFCTLALAAPSKTLIRGAALILTMDPGMGAGELGVIENADILLDGDKIAGVGKNLQDNDAYVVDAAGKIVMPGFVDVPNHLGRSINR